MLSGQFRMIRAGEGADDGLAALGVSVFHVFGDCDVLPAPVGGHVIDNVVGSGLCRAFIETESAQDDSRSIGYIREQFIAANFHSL